MPSKIDFSRRIGLGLTPFGGAGQPDFVSPQQILEVLERAVTNYGIRIFDGATLYQSNRQVGKALAELGVSPFEVRHYTKVGRDLVLARPGEPARVSDQPAGWWKRRFPYNRAVARWAWGNIEVRSQIYHAYEHLFDCSLAVPDANEGGGEGIPQLAGVAFHDFADYRDYMRKESGDPQFEIDWDSFAGGALEAVLGEKAAGFVGEIGIGTKETEVTAQMVSRFGEHLDYVMYTGLDILGDYAAFLSLYEQLCAHDICFVKAGMYGGGILKETDEQLPEGKELYNYADADAEVVRRRRAMFTLAREHGLSDLKPVAAGFIRQFLHDGESSIPQIERLIIGADTVRQLDENLGLLQEPGVPESFWEALRVANYDGLEGETPVIDTELPLPIDC